jgi:drug/metabolite transporter (DMT)-like permease
VAIALGRVFLQEAVTPAVVFGMVTILAGVAIASAAGWSRDQAAVS